MVAPKIKMKAILHKEFGGPEVLGLSNDVEIPQIEKHEVLIQVHAAGINRPDILQRSGGYPPPRCIRNFRLRSFGKLLMLVKM